MRLIRSTVLGVRNLEVPLPVQPTYFTCVLNNGIHFVETPAGKLEMDESIIDQEFELCVERSILTAIDPFAQD